MSVTKALCAKAILLVLIISIIIAIFLFGVSKSNTSNDTDEENHTPNLEYLNTEIERYISNGQPIVKLPKYGVLAGSLGFTAWTNQTILQFLNVPYAESPSRSRRFKAPVPIRPWKGIRNAGNYGIKCPTVEDLKLKKMNNRHDLEDCLNMAVFSTKLNASNPVMVYIHGGGFYSNNAENYPPNYLMERDIVLVVIQYRLDVLGFLSTNSDEIPGNAGLMDSVQALKFIKENIQHFGGDPNKVTIFGQSSGAAMVSALVISPAVPRNLFQQAIVQSGSIFANWAYSTDPVPGARDIAEAAELDPNQSITALNQAFVNMDIHDLFKAVDKLLTKVSSAGKMMSAGRSLTIGGPDKLLPDTPEKIVKSKSYNQSVPLMVGITKHDGSYVAAVLYDYLAATNKLNDKNFMVNDLVNHQIELLGNHDDSETFAAAMSLLFWPAEELASGNFTVCVPGIIDMLGMGIFKAPILKLAKINTRHDQSKTFLYSFDYKGEHTRFGYGADVSHYPFSGGVHHSDDLIYLFPYPADVAELNAADTKIAQIMVDLWTSFAIDGVPKLSQMQSDNLMSWEPFNGLHGPYLHIDQHLKIDNDFREEFTVAIRNASLLKRIY